jgi:hypothetical protein
MPKLHIPRLGDHLILGADWHFSLIAESRNESLIKATGVDAQTATDLAYSWAGQIRKAQWDKCASSALSAGWIFDMKNHDPKSNYNYGVASFPFTIPTGAILSVERIYIRRGQADFDSVSFSLIRDSVKGTEFGDKLPKKGRVRFWAKLDDVNEIILARKVC